ncbi:GIN domain-containing protein [Sphingomonas sp.]|uniref:GIN domain-containing protein n=1 Tax=Sphingomonas sp. TaxID=28214 RepID=UPI00286A0C6C|nr:DUF2807 domain-containing protein [Sphingomonas sp.]
MRIIIPIIALLACVPTPSDAANRNFGVSGFDRIRIDGPYKVRLANGVAPYAIANGSAAALDAVAMDVQGRTLVVRSNRSSWGGYPGEATGPVEISIGTHELNTAWVNGSGSLAIDRLRGLSFDLAVQGAGSASVGQANVDQLKISIAGTGSVIIAGIAPKLTALVRGISTLDASGLAAKDATIGAQGPATVKVHVTETAKVDAQGAAVVDLAGRPACTVKAIGSATVSGCR